MDSDENFDNNSPPPSDSLALCFSFDPVLDETMQRLLDDDLEQRRRRLAYNNVLDVELSDDRCKNIDWCHCHNENGIASCSAKSRPRSSFCCKEGDSSNASVYSRKLAAKVDGLSCIVKHQEFFDTCLNRTALTAAAKILSERDPKFIFKVNYTNREFRYVAYRNAANWIYDKLQRHNRRVLPACVVAAIRQAFPKEPNEAYTGFRISRAEVLSDSDDELDGQQENDEEFDVE